MFSVHHSNKSAITQTIYGRRRVMQRVDIRDGLLWHLHV
jgi:hypothetical protein